MEIRSFYKAIAPGVSIPLGAFDGIAPYTWSIKAGGIGGTVDSNGLYTAPANAIGVDTVIVTDSTPTTPLTASYDVFVGSPLHLLCDIIQTRLGLASDQVILFNNKFTVPNDSRLYVAVSPLTPRVFGSSNKYDPNQPSNSLQSVNVVCPCDVAIYSRSTEALLRKEEVVMAFDSNYARNQQAVNSFYVGKVSPNIVTIKGIEGSAIPYFFNIQVNIQYRSILTVHDAYFDTFDSVDVKTNP